MQTENTTKAERTQHTPGPWFDNGDGTVSTEKESIATIHGFLTRHVANAHLIAAAPELLEACKEADELTHYLIGHLTAKDKAFIWPKIVACNQKLKAAIVKAERN